MYADDMKAFIKPGPVYLFLGIGLIALGIHLITDTLISLLFLACGVFLIWMHISNRKSMNRILMDLEKSGEMLNAIADFPESQVLARGSIRLSNRYLYAKKKGVILPIRDITQMSLTVNAGKELQNLFCTDVHGKRHYVCTLPWKPKANGDMALLIMTIRSKNPNIKF